MKRKVVALTGGIGSGKSTVAEILRNLGFAVLNCDEIARKVEKTPAVLEGVANLLGEDYLVDGQLARGKIREKIFADEQLYKQYSALFWGKISEELTCELENAPEIVFVEIAVMDAFDFDWTEIWQVQSSCENMISRVTARDGVSAENVKNVIARQRQLPAPTRIIPNDGSLEDLKQAVLAAAQAFVNKRLT